jgi:RNA polymerase sigma factor (sigma-70 family)
MNPEKIYLENLPTIERIVQLVARRNRLDANATAEFVQEVRVRLIADDYALIRKFEDRSTFTTYLTTIITRLFHQYRVEQWGKWRPSAEAKRLGNKAITLERLLTRDGYSFNEAVKILTTSGTSEYSVAELEAIYLRLPPRNPRPVLVSDEAVAEIIAVDGDADDRVKMHDRERAARRVAEAVDRVLETMDVEDRLILQSRFWKAMKVPEIARSLNIEQKRVYKRLDKLFAVLKRGLQDAGIERAEIAALLVHGDQEIRFDIGHDAKPPVGPSDDGMRSRPEPVRVKEESFELAVPLPAATPADRFVRADVWEDREASRYAERIEPRHPYFLRIRIAPEGGRGAKADTAFDESQLPPSPTGHELTIALFELRDGGHEPASPPAKTKVHLPPDRAVSSTEAWFPVLTPPDGAFVARVVVLHETRVLQTLILRAPTGASQNDVTLKQENVVRQSFEDLGARRTFDAALVLNDAGGVPGVMAVTEKSVAYREPVDLRTAIDSITKAVNELTKLADTNDITIDDDDVVSVLIRLANDGHILSKWIARNLPPEIAGADRIQILEAREGAFLPLEFVYPSYAPEDSAKICPHGKEDLARPQKTKCPNERDRNFVCPAVFWGFSRVLERFPHPPADREPFDYRLSTPKPERTTIHPFESALVGASAKVRPDDVTGADGVVPAMRALVKDVFVAQTWDDWSTEIREHSPSLLLLFPHSEEVDDKQALEIGSKFLKISFLEEEYVRRSGTDPGPLVLLLGCSTTLPRVRFHSFVAEFRALGASIVVGTLSLIRGRHATRFVKELVGALAKRAGTPDAVFGDVLLDVKRSMLAAGDPFALTLMVYGDADWRL